ncbi:MAG TPA: beta-propeller fold lactonase family protein [Actinophytocola sp.]|uniref:beta-propeller fold lactonase family protein n=1 Tax=Actinophytocola sp. TaxID=1872138 RepID=UPI002DBE2D12|nr:beta-propeller fold lactonase family protein [Actinophytocola sp.]HEU5475577.1 beta-propeller fold lactonase family protein [Actinophytocola sp.]
MSDENKPASPSDADGDRKPVAPDPVEEQLAESDEYDYNPPTEDFPAYERQPAGGYPGQPQWSSAPAQTVVRLRLRDHLLVGLSMVLALTIVTAVGYMWSGGSLLAVQQTANDQSAPAGDGSAPAGNAEADTGAVDLRQGAVFVMSNDAKGNEVAAFFRNQDGALTEVGRYQTGGKGSGSVEDVSQALVVGTADGEASPTNVVNKAELLFVPNMGSNSISVFRIKADGLELASKVPSGGEKPVSLTVSKGLLYVLHSGEYDDRLWVGEGLLENCTTGQLPSVNGFRVAADGTLTQIEGSTRPLTEERDSGCAQIGFSPDGKTLVATERRAGKTDEATGFPKGAILTFAVRENGTLAPPVVNESAGNGPYGFTFTKDGTLLMAEQNGADRVEGVGQVSSYSLAPDGTIKLIKGPVATGQTDTCWIVAHTSKNIAFASAPLANGTISSFSLAKDGGMSLQHAVATAEDGVDRVNDNTAIGLLDIGLSGDSRFLYGLDAFAGGVYAFRVNDNGSLTSLGRKQVFDYLPITEGGHGGSNGIATF